jgi:hypothetical protein
MHTNNTLMWDLVISSYEPKDNIFNDHIKLLTSNVAIKSTNNFLLVDHCLKTKYWSIRVLIFKVHFFQIIEFRFGLMKCADLRKGSKFSLSFYCYNISPTCYYAINPTSKCFFAISAKHK